MDDSALQSKTVDWLRFPCAVLVVMIHAFTFLPQFSEEMGVGQLIGVLFSKVICRVAVPIFFLISSFFFYKKLEIWDWSIYKDKLKRRFVSLVIPYLLWNVVMILYILITYLISCILNHGISTYNILEYFSDRGGYLMFWNCARYGIDDTSINLIGMKVFQDAPPINYPLWFVRDLIVLNCLSPLFYFIVKHLKAIGLILLYLIYVINIRIPIDGISPEGCFYYGLGCYLCINHKNIVLFFSNYKRVSYLLASIFMVICLFTYGSQFHLLFRRLFTLFGVSSSFCITSAFLKAGKIKVRPLLTESSFVIFASHTIGILPLTYIVLNLFFTNDSFYLLKYFLSTAFTVTTVLIIFSLAKKFIPRTINVLTGLRHSTH